MKSSLEKSHKLGQISESELPIALSGLKKDYPKGIPKCGSDALRFGLASYDVKSEAKLSI